MKKGRMRSRITVERKGAPVDDGYTTIPGGWIVWCKAYAAVFYGSGNEQRQAAQEQAAQAASFEVAATTKTRTISVADRISFDGALWDITGNHEIERGAGRRITAVRKAA